MIRLGDHVVVRGEDREAIVTAVHPDAQVEGRVSWTPPAEGRAEDGMRLKLSRKPTPPNLYA